MKKIEYTITDNSIICLVEQNETITYIFKDNYEEYKKIIEEANRISLKVENISIINNSITFSNNDTIVEIKNYQKNKSRYLGNIIDRIIKEKQKRRKKELKKRKINRNPVIKGFAIILSLALGFNMAAENIKSIFETIKDEDIPDIPQQEETIDNNNIDYEKINSPKFLENSSTTEELEEKTVENIEFESRTNEEKFINTKAYYEEIITKISNQYGVDPQIMIAIATQEQGIHKVESNTPAIGLMQIERAVWNNATLTAYNYEIGQYETIYITEEKLADLEFNIKTACMYFQECLKKSNYNLLVAIQMYNFGYGNIEQTFKLCYGNDIDLYYMFNACDNAWLENRRMIGEGDNEYLEHILSYIVNFNNIKCRNGNKIVKYNFLIPNISRKYGNLTI